MSKAQVDAKINAEGRCRFCLRSASVRPLTRHRIVPGSAGGRYVPQNVVPLCVPCHKLIDGRDPFERRWARRTLRARMWPAEIAQAARWPIWSGWSFALAYPRPTREEVLKERREDPLLATS